MKVNIKPWQWKFFHPSQWGWWKSKAKPLMIPVAAGDIAHVLAADEFLYDEVIGLVEEIQEEEEEDEEVPPPDGSYEDELDDMIEDLEQEEDPNQYFDSEVAELVEAHSTAPTIGDLIQEKMAASNTITKE